MPNTREKLRELLCDVIETDGCSGHCNFPPCYLVKACADHLIANGVTVQKWIPVSERLPDKMQKVLTVSDTGYIDVDFVDKFGVWIGDVVRFCKVTHWMPLPEPPKGE